MPNDEKQEKEPAQIIQRAADALFDGILAFGEGMLSRRTVVNRRVAGPSQELQPLVQGVLSGSPIVSGSQQTGEGH
jgi:hypothetical protein